MSHDLSHLHFFQHLDLVLQHQKLILSQPEFYYFHLAPWYIGATPIGQKQLYLGDLIYFWEKNPIWFNRQPEVVELIDGWSRGRKKLRPNTQGIRVVQCTGSALSGANSALGWDEATKTLIKFSSPSVFALLKQLDDLKLIRPQRPLMQYQVITSVDDLIQQLK